MMSRTFHGKHMRFFLDFKAVALFIGAFFTMTAVLKTQEVRFLFAPPDGFTETAHIRRGRHITRGKNTRKDTHEMDFRWTAHLKGKKYHIERHILSNRLFSDGQIVASPMLDAMVGVTLTYYIDAVGKAIEIKGYNKILANLNSKFPPQLIQNLGDLEPLRNENLAEWHRRVGQFVGRTVHIGESWTSKDKVKLPDGDHIVSYNATVFAGWKVCREEPCMQIHFFADSDPVNLYTRVNQAHPATLKRFNHAPRRMSNFSFEGEGESIVNPRTLRTDSEKHTRTITRVLNGGSNAGPLRVLEFNEYTTEPD